MICRLRIEIYLAAQNFLFQVLREMVFNLLCICWEIVAPEVEDFDAEPVENKTGSCTPGIAHSSSNYCFSDQIFSPLKRSWMILMTQSENVSKLKQRNKAKSVIKPYERQSIMKRHMSAVSSLSS